MNDMSKKEMPSGVFFGIMDEDIAGAIVLCALVIATTIISGLLLIQIGYLSAETITLPRLYRFILSSVVLQFVAWAKLCWAICKVQYELPPESAVVIAGFFVTTFLAVTLFILLNLRDALMVAQLIMNLR